MQAQLITQAQDLPADFQLSQIAPRPPERAVLMADPDHYAVAYAINPHMLDAQGQLNQVDSDRANEEWERLREAFSAAGLEVRILPAVPGLPDLVFTANQSLAFVDRAGQAKFIASTMRSPERAPEAAIVAAFHRQFGLDQVAFPLAAGESMEGAGDLLLLPGRRFCLAGVGPRTSRTVLERLPSVLEMPVAVLELAGEDFYHLDTCVCPLDDQRVLAHLPALRPAAQELLQALYELVLAPAPEEAELSLACNAVVLPNGSVLVEAAAPKTRALLELAGFRCESLSTAEYLKSGGSLFCMKLFLP